MTPNGALSASLGAIFAVALLPLWAAEAEASPKNRDTICAPYKGTSLWGKCTRAVVHGCDESDLAHRRCAQWADLWRDQTGVEPPWLICGGQGYCTVFVTSATQQGNFGGITAADAICNDLAEQEGLQGVGNYMAWVSDDDESPSTRFNQAAGQYRLADGTTVVADDWDDLTDGTLQHAIDMLEDGTELTSPAAVWTSTGPDGTGRFPHCDEWTNTVDRAGIIGITAESNSDWTRRAVAGAVQCDRSDPRLYCFQQQ